jgi:tetratricopeptide (TPR) repeat protein
MIFRLFVLGVLSLFLFGCSATITATNVVPPRAGDIKVKEVGVLEIKGDQNAYFANTLSSVIDKLEYKGQKRFQVYDRAQIENIIREQKFQATIADPSTMVKFGRLSGIEAGFFGGLNYTTGSRNYYEKRTRCDKEGKNCSEYSVSCTDTDHALRTTLSLTDFSTAKVLYSNTFNKSRRVKTCQDSSYASSSSTSGDDKSIFDGFFSTESEKEETPTAVRHLTDSADPFVKLVNVTFAEIAKDLGEYSITSTIEIEKSDDTLSSADKARFESGVDFATQKRLDRACDIWGELERSNPRAPNLIFNLGVCKESMADYEGALTYFKKADSLALEPNKMVNRALTRINAKIARGTVK